MRDLPEVAVFASGRYASAWDANGKPTAFSVYTDADLQRMAENDAAIRRTGQPGPYVKPSHDADPVPGQVGPLRYAGGKLYASIEKCIDWLADQIASGVRPWRSAEILRHAEAANYQGVSGPVFKGLALLNTHPRVKTLDSSVYADGTHRFEEPGALPGSILVTFEEAAVMALSGEQTIALLKALGGDQKLLEKAVAAINGETSGGGDAPPAEETPPAPMGDKPVVQMSDLAAAKLAKLEADNALLRAGLDEQKRQRVADISLARTQQLNAFADQVSITHGKAVADRAKASAEVRFKLLPATENFGDGKDLVAEVFSEITGLIGPATVKRAASSAVTPTGAVEEFSEDAAKLEIFAECKNPVELKFIKSAAGEGLLKAAIKRKRDEFAEREGA